jgi:hypothetical protein
VWRSWQPWRSPTEDGGLEANPYGLLSTLYYREIQITTGSTHPHKRWLCQLYSRPIKAQFALTHTPPHLPRVPHPHTRRSVRFQDVPHPLPHPRICHTLAHPMKGN